MKKSIIISTAVIAALGIASVATFAATGTATGTRSQEIHGQHGGPSMSSHMGPGAELTDTEKTALESMTDTEKQAFFDKKRTESETKRDAREAVIDKLLAGTALTTDEETLRKEIITERAERKAKQVEMKTNMEKIQAIMDKKKAGTTLTTEEQTLLDSMPKMGNMGKMMGRGGRGR